MTAPEVEWVFDTLKSIVNDSPLAWGSVAETVDGTVPVRRVDRDESSIYDLEPIRSRTADLQASNLIGVSLQERPSEPAGTDAHRVEAIVGVRVEGLHHSEWGHIDPDGVEGVAFEALYSAVRQTLRDARSYPDVDRPATQYRIATVENDTNRSSNYSDHYEYRLDVRFRGFER